MNDCKRCTLFLFGGYEIDYPRTEIIRKGWQRCGLPVVECRVSERWKVFQRYPVLLWNYLRNARKGSLIYVPVFRHKDVPLAWILSRMTGKRVIFDPLVSRYETRVLDRGDVAEGSLQAAHNRNIDRVSFRLPDHILADTEAHRRYYIRTLGVGKDRVSTLYIGFDDDLFPELPMPDHRNRLHVLFYGTYLPLHGIDTMIEAAILLKDEPVTFTFVGEGQTYAEARKRAGVLPSGKIEFLPSRPVGDLVDLAVESDVLLGIFGKTAKADMVIPNKVFQGLAMGRPMVTGDTPAVRELFRDGSHLLTVPSGDPGALASRFMLLKDDIDLRMRLAAEGCLFVRRYYHPECVAGRLLEIISGAGLTCAGTS